MKNPTAKAYKLRSAPDLVLSSRPHLHTTPLLFRLDILGVLMQACWGNSGSLVLLLFSPMVENRTKRWNQTPCLTTHNTAYLRIGIWIDPCHWHPFPTKWNISSCMVSPAERQSQLQDLPNPFFFYYCVFMCLCVCTCVLTDVYAHMCMDVEDGSWCQMPWLITVCV